MDKEIDVRLIDEILDEIATEIKTCGVMNNSRPRKDCESSCKYRDICDKIFKQNDEEF